MQHVQLVADLVYVRGQGWSVDLRARNAEGRLTAVESARWPGPERELLPAGLANLVKDALTEHLEQMLTELIEPF